MSVVIPEFLRAFFRQLYCLFTFFQQVSHTAVFVRIEGDFLQHRHKRHRHTSLLDYQPIRTFHPRVYATIYKLGWDSCVKLTSSLNWLLSHMDLKLLLFSKSVIFIFNCKGKRQEELDETSATECVKQTLFTMNGSFCEVSFSTEQNAEI